MEPNQEEKTQQQAYKEKLVQNALAAKAFFADERRHMLTALVLWVCLLLAFGLGKLCAFWSLNPPAFLLAQNYWGALLRQWGVLACLILELLFLMFLLVTELKLLKQGWQALKNGIPSMYILVTIVCPLTLLQGIYTVVGVCAWGVNLYTATVYALSGGTILLCAHGGRFLETLFKVYDPQKRSKENPALQEGIENADTTFIEQIKYLVENAHVEKVSLTMLPDRVALFLVPLLLVVAVVSSLSWLWNGFGSQRALEIFMAVLVTGCAAGVFLAVPEAVKEGIRRGRHQGVWFRDATALARVNQVATIIFDKTGTLTEGRPSITDVATFNKGSEQGIITLAAALMQDGTDGISRAFRERAGQNTLPLCTEVRRLNDLVVTARCYHENIRLGPETFVRDYAYLPREAANQALAWQDKGQSVFYLAVGRTLFGMFAVADVLRKESPEVVTELKERNLRTVLMTGDDKRAANHMGKLAGTEQVISELLPAQKADFVQSLQQVGEVVAMVGDGMNDAPALAQADVGMAFGSRLEPLTAASADVVLPKDNLHKVLTCLRLGKKVHQVAKNNLSLALVLNMVALPLAAGLSYFVKLGPWPDGALLLVNIVGILLLFINTGRLRFFK
jgi:cation transport ATPase